jgi:aromatic-L-amino-acid/L-tryptophan decarboxylase
MNTQNETFETLDPRDWDDMRRLAHRMTDDALDYIRTARERPAWRAVPVEVAERLAAPAPTLPSEPTAVYEEFRRDILPYPPALLGLVHGQRHDGGRARRVPAAATNPTSGAATTRAVHVERRWSRWCAELLGFPLDAGGLMVSGASMANLVGWTVARHVSAGIDVRAEGVAAMPEPLVAYASVEVHSCHKRAAELLGLGGNALRLVPTDDDVPHRPRGPAPAIHEDRAARAQAVPRRRQRRHHQHRRDRRPDALADLCAEEGCASTSTAPSARWRCSRPPWRPSCAASSGPTRSPSTCTSGCTSRSRRAW